MSLIVSLTGDIATCHQLRRKVFIEEQAVPEAEEVDGKDGKYIQWGEPLAVLFDNNPKTRFSYPDLICDDGMYITETQKVTARVHRIPDDLLQPLWGSGRP